MIDRTEREAQMLAESMRRDILAQILNAVDACERALAQYAEHEMAMAEGGAIAMAWPGATGEHAEYVAALGDELAAMQAALGAVLPAAQALHAAGVAAGLNLLPGVAELVE
jgi:hypothetical protein